MADTQLGRKIYHAVEHVSVAGHYESDVLYEFKSFFGRKQKVLRPFLHGNAPKKQNCLVAVFIYCSVPLDAEWLYRIVDHLYFSSALTA